MEFLKTGFNCIFKKAFSFSGRSSRYEYWSLTVTGTIVSFIFFIMAFFTLFKSSMASGSFNISAIYIIPVIMGLFFLLYMIAILSSSCRRIHDLGYSAWLYFFATMGGPIFGGLFKHLEKENPFRDLIGIAYVFFSILMLVTFLALYFKRGTVGDNKYGTDPAG